VRAAHVAHAEDADVYCHDAMGNGGMRNGE
jgi:hypothetical protein